LTILLADLVARAKALLAQVKMMSPSPENLSAPATVSRLVFPSISAGLPSTRFGLESGEFLFMGRESFKMVLGWITSRSRDVVRLAIYGTIGYGKSHIVAAAVCLLLKQRAENPPSPAATPETDFHARRVVFIPDCHQLILDPMTVLIDALCVAFADDDALCYEVSALFSCEDVVRFCQNCPRFSLLFILDQSNAFQSERYPAGSQNALKAEMLIGHAASNHFRVDVASPNSQQAYFNSTMQPNMAIERLWMGFSEV
jgi:hypothetical protein